MTYTLIGRDGRPYASEAPGTLGGHARARVYGRLDCPVALSWIRRGSAMPHRVFFADEETAIAAGYRPCGACMRQRYAEWKANPIHFAAPPSHRAKGPDTRQPDIM